MNHHHKIMEEEPDHDNNHIPPSSPLQPPPIPIQFQLLYNWEASADHDALFTKNKNRMFPTFTCEWNGTPIYRLIDYDLDHHVVSAGQLWKSCGLTLTEGLFLFKISKEQYQIDFLLPQFPFCDVWVTLSKARHMASVLGVEHELHYLLTPELDDAFSSDNLARNELVHNWKIESIPNIMYSTSALLETYTMPNNGLEILSGSRKIRTQISRIQRQPGMVCKDRLENGLVRWAVYAYEAFQQQQQLDSHDFLEDDTSSSALGLGVATNGGEEHLNPNKKPVSNAMWDVMQGLLFDLQTLALGGTIQSSSTGRGGTSSRVLSDSMVVGNMPFKREYLSQGIFIQNVYMASMAEKLHTEIQAFGLLSASLARQQQLQNNNNNKNNKQKQRQSHVTTTTYTTNNNNNNDNNNNTMSTSHHTTSEQYQNTSSPMPPTPTMPTTMTTQAPTMVDPQMMLHDRMDSLEQEIYRMKRKYKRRTDDMQTEFQELQQQILALEAWKIRNERSRKSERIWILMISLSLFISLWAIGLTGGSSAH
ncbi:hypothetical protein BDA99DRAFT_271348 [Phascolomyces articulosus]|uniref:Uncharacterized protein n=1 Tax=Phascolomyces articulosus TaxID=60185 RepID=A0AAD5JYP6_9FUNG|nr:hypothetical protein BDA99DRAFT_271348 [Phascolomyces articulosus]